MKWLLLLFVLVGCFSAPPAQEAEPITDATIIFRTFGGFSTPETNIQQLIMRPGEAFFTIGGADGSITFQQQYDLSDQDYKMILDTLLENNFLEWQEQLSAQTNLADVPSGSIQLLMGEDDKVVVINPMVPDAYDSKVSRVLQVLIDQSAIYAQDYWQ